jgi:hypothetical protein
MPPLIGADANRIHILLDGSCHNVPDATVMADMDHFKASLLKKASENIDGSIVPVEERRSCYDPENGFVTHGPTVPLTASL